MDSTDTSFENQSHFTDDPEQSVVQPLSVSDKFIGVLTEPAPTFENVAATGSRTSDWLIPLIALIVVILASTMVRFSNDIFVNDMREKADKAIQERVQAGQMSQEDADKAKEQATSMGGIQKAITAVGVVIGTPIMIMLFAFVYWLLIKFLAKGDATFAIILSVFGLVIYFGVIDQIISIILMFATGNPFANLSPAIFMKPDPSSTLFKIFLAINPISLWSYYVMGIGFHKVAHISRAKGMAFSYVPWAVVTIITALLGFGG